MREIKTVNPYYIVICNPTSDHINKVKYIEKNFKNKIILITDEQRIPGCKNFLRFSLGPVRYMKLITNTLNKFY